MRRDVYIENDSGGLSVVAVDAVDDIIEDSREDDSRFVTTHKALLLELYGDDSLPVRIVADEPLSPEEEAQWLARASWQIDTSDGRILVMGGFDPDVLIWWKEGGGNGDGRGIGEFTVAPGRWNVDVYAHVGSMNGRALLREADERPGAAFRRHHPNRAFPLWLAKMLEFSGEDDPSHEELWKDVRSSMNAGRLTVDTDGGDAVGFVVHVTRAEALSGDPPAEIWFGRSDNARLPDPFPVGLRSEAPDPGLRSFHDKLLGIEHPPPESPRPVADRVVEIMEVWEGPTLRKLDGTVDVAVDELFLMHWIAAFASDATPIFELWVWPASAWTPPEATPDIAVARKSGNVTAIGPVANTGGWHTWWTARDVARSLGDIPDQSNITLGMVARRDEPSSENVRPDVGRALYSGAVSGGRWQIGESSPSVPRDTLAEAVEFARDVAINGRLRVRAGAERAAYDEAARKYKFVMAPVAWDGEFVALVEPDERLLIMLATPVFRARFHDAWPVDVESE